jgi:hypothetical protein
MRYGKAVGKILSSLSSLYHNNKASLIETAEIVLINPLYPSILGDTPRTPARSIPHLFFNSVYTVRAS